MNPCQRFKEHIFDLVDNELDILRKKELDRHLKACIPCSRFLEQIRRLRSQCKQLDSVKVSEEFHVLLRERIRREMAGKRRALTPSIAFSTRWIPAFGIVVVVMCVGFWMLDQKTSFLGKSDKAVSIARTQISQPQDFEGEVQYIIDDYLNLVAVPRSEGEETIQLTNRDSMYYRQRQEDIQGRLTPVSF